MAWVCRFLEMKLATLKARQRDGCLVVVSRDLTKVCAVADIVPNLQAALDDWAQVEAPLQHRYQALNEGRVDAFAFEPNKLAAPLPRAYQWLDGSAYLSHVERVRKARGAVMPDSFQDDPLMYQGGSDSLLGANDAIILADPQWGLDFEAEVGVITDAVEQGISVEDAADRIRLIVLINDLSLRNLIPDELAKGFGFIHGKPASALSPVAVTPDQLGAAWRQCKLHLPLTVHWNERLFGQANAGVDMQFNFARLINHAAKTRSLAAGTIIGSGTVSNADSSVGYSCIVEQRVVEIIESGQAQTDFMNIGDSVRIEMFGDDGHSLFGAIKQEVVPWR